MCTLNAHQCHSEKLEILCVPNLGSYLLNDVSIVKINNFQTKNDICGFYFSKKFIIKHWLTPDITKYVQSHCVHSQAITVNLGLNMTLKGQTDNGDTLGFLSINNGSQIRVTDWACKLWFSNIYLFELYIWIYCT